MGTYPKGNPEYSHPEFTTLKSEVIAPKAMDGGVPDTTLLEAWKAPWKLLVRGVRLKIKTAGTAGTHAFLLKSKATPAVAGTVVATITCGSTAANYWVDGTLTTTTADLTIGKGTYLCVNTVASMVCDADAIVLDYQRVYDESE